MAVNNSDAFDRLVSGLSTDDRRTMLNKINKSIAPSVKLVETEPDVVNQNVTLKIKFNNESIFYKLILWFRSIIEKKQTDELYNEDVISKIAKKVNREHPGLINHKIKFLDMVFYQRVVALKEAAEFFRPYLSMISTNPGDFYVFLSSYVTPEIEDRINKTADPFTLDFIEEPNIEKRNEMLKKLDEVLNNLPGNSREVLYEAISSVMWLQNFCKLPLLHFVSQFTNVVGDSYTSPYTNVRNDFDALAALFGNISPINNEILEAIFLYSKKKEIYGNSNIQDKDLERAIKEFLAKANGSLGKIQLFISAVPILKIGKIINESYDWNYGNPPGGAEAWFPAFRVQWRKIIDIRWNDWVREQKKYMLSNNLQNDFALSEFPVIKYKPWETLWLRVPFACELTGGFLSWFALEQFNTIMPIMNDVMLEGVFVKNENRTEYSEALNLFVQANNQMLELLERLSPDGEFGALFEEFSTSRVRTLQVQNQIDSMMASTESLIHDCVSKMQKSCSSIDSIYRGIFNPNPKAGMHDTLQNLNTIKGHQNRIWRDKLFDTHGVIRKTLFYINELAPIDASTQED